MRREAATLLLVISLGPMVVAADLDTAYFRATVPGSWVSYETASEGVGEYRYTYARLPDRDGRPVIEFSMEVLSGPGSGSSTRQLFVLERGFDLSEDAIGYMKSVEVMILQAGQGEAMLQPAAIVSAVREGTCDYGGFTRKGRDRVGDLECDLYAFEARCGGAAPSTEVGEICLSAAVPFGVVRQVGTMRDADGKVLSTTVQSVRDHGSGARGSSVLLAKIPGGGGAEQRAPGAKSVPIPLAEAYRRGLVEIHVEVVPESAGRRLVVSLTNRTSDALVVVIPEGTTRLEAGSPVDTLEMAAATSRTVTMSGRGSAAPIDVGQGGRRGAVEGDFTLSMYEGEPLFMGSVTMGPLGR